MLSPPPLFPADTTKFFGCELGAQTKHDAASGMSIVNGAHETAKLQQLLEGFIKTFVQCYACHNPETVMAIDKAECITMRCKACGHLSKVDMRHKLTTFILKNPPENKESKAEKKLRRAEQERLKEGEAVDEEARKARKAAKSGGGAADDALRVAIKALKKRIKAAEEAGDEATRKALKKEYKKLKEQAAAAEGGDGGDSAVGAVGRSSGSAAAVDDDEEEEEEGEDDDDPDVQWSTDTSREAAAARAREQLSAETAKMVSVAAAAAAVSTLGISSPSAANGSKAAPPPAEEEEEDEEEGDGEEEEEADVDPAPSLKAYATSHTASETAAYLALLSPPPKEGTVALLLRALYGGMTGTLAPLLAKQLPLLVAAAGEGAAGQRALLTGLEHFAGVAAPAAVLKQTAVLIKAMYDADVLEEAAIDAWFEAPDAAAALGVPAAAAAGVRKQAFPFVNWLRTADSDEDEDDE